MECLICKRTGQKLFNISLRFGDGQNTIKDDIIEFVGVSIADRLDDTQHVCNICMNTLDDIVKSKHTVIEAILAQNGHEYIPKLGRFWTYIAKSYQSKFEQDAYSDPLTPSLTPNTPTIPISRDPTPLTFVAQIKPYNENVERVVERREAIKSELARDQRILEYKSALNKGKKIGRKERNRIRSKSADVKRARRQLVKSAQSEMMGRPVSVASELSFVSFTGEEETERKNKKRKQPQQPTIIYDGDEIIYPLKRTRSVSRCHQKNLEQREKMKEQEILKKLFYCPYESCKGLVLDGTLEVYTSHMVITHSQETYYKCWSCGNEFINNDHLNLHLRTHDVYPVMCAICELEQKNVAFFQKHISQHLALSYKCYNCDRDFVTKTDCNNHVFSKHKRRKAYNMVASKIKKSCFYKKPNISSTKKLSNNETTGNTKKKYHFSYMNVSSPNKSTPFRGRSYFELDHLQRKRIAQPELNVLVEGESDPTSLGDDLVYNTNVVEGFTINRRTPAGASSGYRTSSRCSTPYEGLNMPMDDEPLEFDMGEFDNSNWLSSRRDLESRNTEVANIMGAVSEGDVNSVHEGYGSSVSDDSDVEEAIEADNIGSDVETETQYLDKNGFVASINYDCDSNGEKS